MNYCRIRKEFGAFIFYRIYFLCYIFLSFAMEEQIGDYWTSVKIEEREGRISVFDMLDEKEYCGKIPLIALNKGPDDVTINVGKGKEENSYLDKILLSFVLKSGHGKRLMVAPGYFFHIETGEVFPLVPWRFNQSVWTETERHLSVSVDKERYLNPVFQKNYFVFQNCSKGKSAKLIFLRWFDKKRVITCNISPDASHFGNSFLPQCDCVIAQCLDGERVMQVIQRRWKEKEGAFFFFVLRDDGIYIQEEAIWDD